MSVVENKSLSDQMIELTQNTRLQMIKEMTKDGVPTDSRSARVLNEIMSGGDSTALAVKKLNDDNNNAAKNREAALIAAQMIKQRSGNPFTRDSLEKEINTVETEKELPQIELLPGEGDIGSSPDLNYNNFMEKFEVD